MNFFEGQARPAALGCRTSVALDAATLARLYPGGETEYVAKFATAADNAVRRGYWLLVEAVHYKAGRARCA